MYDLAIIGGGPAGYVSAIKASHLGLKVALIEKDRLGGTCLIRGCIPTKTLLTHASVLKTVKTAHYFGIQVEGFTLDYSKMKEKKDLVVNELVAGIEMLMKACKIDVFEGIGSFIDNKTIKIKGRETKTVQAKNIIIATGSIPGTLDHVKVDKTLIHDSTSILEITKIPKHLIIIGGGYIGCEFASLYHELGAKVTIVEVFDKLVSAQGEKIADTLTLNFKKRGINLILGVSVNKVENLQDKVLCTLSNGTTLEGDSMLVSTGRKPFSDRLHLDAVGLGVNERGFIAVNEYLETNVSNIYAIGDITGKSMLAHCASYQGIVAAENVANYKNKADYSCIPAVIFTDPEIATAGLTLEMALKNGINAKSAVFPFNALGKAKASLKEDGYVEIVFGEKYHQVLGGSVIGDNASILIAEISLAIKNELTLEAIVSTIHAHPTMSEAWAEAAEVGLNHPIHLPKKNK